ALELDGDARARVRAGRRRPELLEVDDLDGRSGELVQQAVDVALSDDRDDVPLRLGEVTELRSHRGVPFVDQAPLRRRKLPGELLDEGRLVSIETLQFRLDPLLAREEAPDRRCEEANSLAERHVSPDATENRPGALVDQRDLPPAFLGRQRGRAHIYLDIEPEVP